jgi:hypothetical protein
MNFSITFFIEYKKLKRLEKMAKIDDGERGNGPHGADQYGVLVEGGLCPL